MANRLGTFLLARRRSATIIAALVIALVVTMSGMARAGDRWLADLRGQAMTRPMSGDLLLVEIDSHSLSRIRSWPWPRRLHAAMLDRLNAAGARQVAFDVDFSATSDPADDQALAEAIRRMPRPVILPGAIQRASTTSEVTVQTMPIAPFRQNALLATNLSTRDGDDIVRRQPMWKVIEGLPRPSLAAALAGHHPGEGRKEFSFDLRFDPLGVPRVSAIDLIEGRVDPARIRGRQVLIGGTGIEVGDRVVLPRVGTIPGVFTHVMGFETLHAGTRMSESGTLPVLALTLLLGGIAASVRSRRVAGGLFALTFAALAAGPFAAERYLDLRVAVVPGLAALATLVALRAAASIARSYRTGIATDARSGLPNALAMREEASLTGHADVAVARINNLAEIRAVLDDGGTAELMRKVCERLALVAGDMRIYHTGDGAFAWLVRADGVDELADRFDALYAIMASPIRTGARQIDVQMTYGMSTRQPNAIDALRTATVAAEQAAAQGQRWRAFSASDHDAMDVRMALIGELESAIDLGQIWVAYQPKYDLATRSITSAEALVRWLHPERGAIRPDHFIPLAEEHGRIAKLTRHVLDIALGDFSTLGTATHKPVVAVNLSATLLSAPNLVEMVCDALWRHGMLPHQLTLEVTESAAMSSDDAAIAALETLRTMGIGVSIDDYGTGQSTLAYLKRLPATEIKIDQSFIRAIGDSRSDEILVASTIQLGHQLGMKVVAEGVETEAALRKLEAAGCDIVQGYLIAKPMPFTDFVRVYRDPPRIAA